MFPAVVVVLEGKRICSYPILVALESAFILLVIIEYYNSPWRLWILLMIFYKLV